MTIDEYRQISNDVWVQIFKYSFESDLEDFCDHITTLNEKYGKNSDAMRFFRKLTKVYFDELVRIRG